MSARVSWTGLAELRAALRELPAHLAGDGSLIIEDVSASAANAIRDGYPERTGNLKAGVRTEVKNAGRFGAGIVVKNTAKHAHLFETGTQARHTQLGANRGAMPAGKVFIPIIVRKRREMYERLKAMMVAHGLKVSGDA